MPQGSTAVIGGTGHQGRGIAQRLAAAGFSVVVGSRDPVRAQTMIAAWPLSARSATSATYPDAIAGADIVVLAVPFDTVGALIGQHLTLFKANALVVDVTVPLTFTTGAPALASLPEGSAAAHIRARLRADVRLAATFKTVPAHLLGEIDQRLECDEFVCGDSPDARSEACGLVEAVKGLRAIDIGSLARARSLEHLTLMAVTVNRLHRIRTARFRIVGL